MYCVYKHTAPNGKVYIGITGQNPIKRWNAGHGYKRNEYFYRAIVKYGWDNFKHEILFTELTKEEACQKEIELIAKYKSNNKDFGFNHSIGGDKTMLGYKVSEEAKEKMRIAATGRTSPNKGKFGEKNPCSKSVKQYTEDMILICEYPGLCEAARANHISHADISKCCNGKRKTAGGYKWRYKEMICI